MTTIGVLPRQTLRELMKTGHIQGVAEKYLNPASVDLPLAGEAYRFPYSFLPRPSASIRMYLSYAHAKRHDLAQPLERNVPYLIRIEGQWRLPPSVYGYANPKSTSGRLGLYTKLIADCEDMNDRMSNGWGMRSKQELWVLVRPVAFPVCVAPGLALAQLRLFDGASFLDELSTDLAIGASGLLFDESRRRLLHSEVRRHADALFLSVKVGEEMGWVAREGAGVLDMTAAPGSYDPAGFFEPLSAARDEFVMRAGRFYILATKERVMVPPHLSAELREVDTRLLEGRVHGAGYIDPGWGYGDTGEQCGRPITLEVVPGCDMLLQDGQQIARIRYERMKEPPDISYDSGPANYAGHDGVALAKYFKK